MQRVLSAAATGLLLPLLFAVPAPAAEAPFPMDDACDSGVGGEPGEPTREKGVLDSLLGLEGGLPPGADGSGVVVAVIDSGVSPAGLQRVAGDRPVDVAHGTMVAGLIQAVAPKAGIQSWNVVASEASSGDGQDTLESRVDGSRLLAALRAATRQRVDVINLSLNLPEDEQVEAAIRQAIDAGITVVAAAGNRPVDGDRIPDEHQYEPGEEAVEFPATVEGVLGVTGLSWDGSFPAELLQTGPGLDVSAPAMGARTVDAHGVACLVPDHGSSWGTGVVSGLAALLVQKYGNKPGLVAGRIMATAQGGTDDAALDGHGLVQPLAALTASLSLDAHGNPVGYGAKPLPPEQVAVPAPEADHSDERRSTLVWWGLGGGGALVAALLLRPLVVRRRPE